ncbi:MAG: hypothetical protein ACRDK2_13130 [Solirubrobacteraceae bacterium]
MRDESGTRQACDQKATPGDDDDKGDWAVLSILLDRDGHRGLWSVEEIGRALNGVMKAIDAVGRLQRDGLIHRQGDFVFPTRAASRFNEIVE